MMKTDMATKPLALLVEYDNDLAEQCNAMLTSRGYRCSRVMNREEALTRLELEAPDVLVIDLGATVDVGARDILQRLRTDKRLAAVKTVLFAENEESVGEYKGQVGAILYKPIPGPQLVEMVDKLMGK